MKHYLLFLFFVSFPVSILSAQTIIYVDLNATGANTGANWSNAFTSLHQALDQAVSGDEVWVAEGTYYPTDDLDREKYFFLKSGVKLYGGFNKTETNVNMRDLTQHKTVLSGDIGVKGDSTDNSYCIVYALNPETNIQIDGFQIQFGNANKFTSNLLYTNGSAILTEIQEGFNGIVTIQNCIIKNNFTVGYGAVAIRGPWSETSNTNVNATISNCIFENNKTLSSGSGLMITAKANPLNPVIISNCEFKNNNAVDFDGGATYLIGSNIHIYDCMFLQNYSKRLAGALYVSPLGTDTVNRLQISRCNFQRNSSYYGSGINIRTFSTHTFKSVNLDSNTFTENEGVWQSPFLPPISAAFNIDLLDSPSDVYVTNNVIRNNKGTFSFGVYNTNKGKIVFDGNLLENDIWGSELAGEDSLILTRNIIRHCDIIPSIASTLNSRKVLINNNIFDSNATLKLDFLYSGVISNNLWLNNSFESIECPSCQQQIDTALIFNNNIFWNNTNKTNTPGLTWKLPVYNVRAKFKNNIFDFNASDVLPSEWVMGTGNIFGQYPMFIDTANGNYRLDPCSPAINAGITEWLLEYNIEKDQAGNTRVKGNAIDIGPIENQGVSFNQSSGSTPSCENDSTGNIILGIENVCEPYQIAWQNGNQNGSNLESLSAGIYNITVTDSKGNNGTIQIIVQESNMPEVSQFNITDANCGSCKDGEISFNGDSIDLSFLWSTGGTNANIDQLSAGEYTCTITNTDGCSKVFSFTVGLTNSVDDPLLAQFQIWPNPFQYSLHLITPVEYSCLVEVIDMTGRVLYLSECSGNITLHSDSWYSGVFLVNVKDENGNICFSKKVIKY